MNSAIFSKFKSLRVWEGGGERAPNKPLLLLWVLSRYAHAAGRLIPYREVEASLTPLLREFGPQRSVYHSEYPFWYLQSHGLWDVDIMKAARQRIERRGYPTRSDLRKGDARGGFPMELYEVIRTDGALLASIAKLLLEATFPPSVAEDVADALGFELSPSDRQRDSRFRRRVLTVYEYRCAICGLDARIGFTPVALEAAHIKWHQAGGPDVEQNGLALCSLHHKLFDRGGLTISDQYRTLVSEHLHGSGSFGNLIIVYHDQPAREPVNSVYAPDLVFLRWHREQVFKGPARP